MCVHILTSPVRQANRFNYDLASGKTLPLWLCITFLDAGKTTVLILPWLEMQHKYRHLAQVYNVTCEVWSPNNPLVTSRPQLLLVAAESGGWEALKGQLRALISSDELARIVIKHAHLLVKDPGWHRCCELLQEFDASQACVVLVTATLPCHLEQPLFQSIGRPIHRILRHRTESASVTHSAIALTSMAFETIARFKIMMSVSRLTPPERAVVVCLSNTACEHMAEKLSWVTYHASTSAADRASHLEQWRSGACGGIVTTYQLINCFDCDNVRVVFHLGIPPDSIDYMQAVGCVSQNSHGESIIYFNPTECQQTTGDDPFGKGPIHDGLATSNSCRNIRILFFLEGVASSCTMLLGRAFCDVCQEEMDNYRSHSSSESLIGSLGRMPSFPSTYGGR